MPFPSFYRASYRALVYRDPASGFTFFHQEDQRNHDEDGYAEKAKVIEISQHGGLPLQCAFNQGVSLLGGE
jgi:hypothetical protein